MDPGDRVYARACHLCVSQLPFMVTYLALTPQPSLSHVNVPSLRGLMLAHEININCQEGYGLI